MTHRALAQEGPDLRREDLDIPSPRRRRHRHKGLARSRSNAVEDSRLGRRYFTGRFCPVHNWPVFRCPPRIPAISQKMLIQQLRQMENDGMVRRIVHHQVPPKVEYALTDWGQALCPALDALLKWAALREEMSDGVAVAGKEGSLCAVCRRWEVCEVLERIAGGGSGW